MKFSKLPKKQRKQFASKSAHHSGQFFNLTRPLDLTSPDFRFLMLGTILATSISILAKVFLLHLPTSEIMSFAATIGGTFFFTHLLAAEILPDCKVAHLTSAVLAVIFATLNGTGDVVVIFWLLMLLRLLNRTSGRSATLWDNALILLLTYWIAHYGYTLYPLVTALVYFSESKLPLGSPRSLYAAGFAFLIIVFLPPSVHSLAPIPATLFLLMIITTILYVGVIKNPLQLTALDDCTRKPLNPLHLQTAQLTVLLVSFFCSWYYGQQVLTSFVPVWSAMLGSGLYILTALINKRIL